jgi:hypothetical protein
VHLATKTAVLCPETAPSERVMSLGTVLEQDLPFGVELKVEKARMSLIRLLPSPFSALLVCVPKTSTAKLVL